MPAAAPCVEANAEWFSMIINYLKMRSMAVWFQLHPESSYEQFEYAWPFMLDEMMRNATRTAIAQLKTDLHPFSVN
jgi:hypothetical protein